MTGSPKNPAFTPDYITPYTDRMNFMQRMHSSAAEIINYWIHYFEYLPTLRQIAQDRFDFPVPPLDEYERNISLVLGNVVFGFQAPRPIAPNVIPVGGMNLHPAKPLEKKLQAFLDGATDGAIFFSLGSNVQSATLPADVQQAFLDVFASLPQRVLWKFETDALKNVPKNVMLAKWLPQTDILGHKNMKLFITHNGLFSSQEAAYFGVPTIGIPFFMDQQGNAALAEKHGVGVSLSSQNLNKEIIQKSIAQILTDSSYAENARRLSRIFRDQPEHPLDRAVFWVEYVLRHGGAPHLRTAAVGMPLYQYLLLDILGALLMALVVTLLLLRAGARWLWRRLGAAGRKEKTN